MQCNVKKRLNTANFFLSKYKNKLKKQQHIEKNSNNYLNTMTANSCRSKNSFLSKGFRERTKISSLPCHVMYRES